MEATTYDLQAALDRLPPIFARCLGDSDHRCVLTKPFVAGDHVYATNGYIAARITTPADWDIPNPEGRILKAESLEQLFEGGYPASLAPLPSHTGKACPECNGALTVPARKCQDCEGGGEIEHECNCEHCTESTEDCENCDGTGETKAGECTACRKTGFDLESDPVAVGEALLPAYYASMLAQFGAELYLSDADPKRGAAHFRIGDVEGIVMPCEPKRGATQ